MPVRTRVIHLAKYYPPYHGGMEEVCEALAEGAAAAGWRVEVECFDPDAARVEEVRGVHVRRHLVRRVVASQPFAAGYLRAVIAALAEDAVVHLHVPNLLAALGVALAPRRRARLIPHWHSDVVAKGWLGEAVKPLEWAMLARADAVVATSPPYAESSPWLRRFGRKVQVIPLGARATAPAAPRDAVRPLVLAVGRLVPYKGLEHLVRAARGLRAGAEVAIVGSGPLRADLERLVADEGVGDRVRLLGSVPGPQLAALYGEAALFCLPSVERSEAFGLVLLEAMAAGLPVVACRIPGSGVPWVNADGETGFNVPTGDPPALAAACNRLLEDADLRAAMGRNARARYASLFTAERTLAQWLALYRA